MAWRRPGVSHYLDQWWLVYWRIYASLGLNELMYLSTCTHTMLKHLSVNKELFKKYSFNTLRPKQNGHHFADDICKWLFLNENVWIPIKISLTFVPLGLINNIPVLVQIMAWRRPGDKPSSEPILVSLRTHVCVTRPRWVNSSFRTYSNHRRRIAESTPHLKKSNQRDCVLKCSYHLGIGQAASGQCCRDACQITERLDNFKHRARAFETLRDITIGRLVWY